MLSSLTELDDHGLGQLVAELDGTALQAQQLRQWIWQHGVTDFAACTNLPKALRERLAARARARSSVVKAAQLATDGTEKLLIELADREQIEAVLIPEGDRTTLCLSTQVGCPVACVFCASGLEGVRRNLTAGEIAEQALHARDRLGSARSLTNVVVMGMGEPLLNLGALLEALDRLRNPVGFGLGARRITVSTSGYPDRMRKLAATPHQYQLAVSLHAADDALRRQLVPTAVASVAEIVAAAATYAGHKGREVTFEIVLLAGVNDRVKDADALADRLQGMACTVNLIPWNPIRMIPDLRRPAPQQVDAFAQRLRRAMLKVTVRRQRGAEHSAACGQLRLHQRTLPLESPAS